MRKARFSSFVPGLPVSGDPEANGFGKPRGGSSGDWQASRPKEAARVDTQVHGREPSDQPSGHHEVLSP